MNRTITGTIEETKVTAALKAMKSKDMRIKYGAADLDGAIISAAKNAERHDKPLFVYAGNSFMNLVYRTTLDKDEALSGINNCGEFIFEVSPDRTVVRHSFLARG